jgi:small-conductance mechanosensitive channel
LLIYSIFSCSFTVWGQNDSIHQPVSLLKIYEPEPVVPFHDTLFYISVGIGSFTPQQRAVSITEKIRNVSNEPGSFHADSLTILSEAGMVYIVYRDIIMMTITEADARLKGKTQLALARDYEKIIGNAIVQRQKDVGWLNILLRVFWVLLIIVVQYFLIRIINHLFRKIYARIEQLKGTKIKTIKFKSYKLMDEEKATKFILFLSKILRILIIVLTLYLSIPMAFSIFPATRGLANVLFGYVLTPFKSIFSSVINFLPDLISIIVIVFVFRYLIRGVRFVAEEIDKGRLTIKGFYPDWAYPTFNIIRTLLYAFMFIVIFPHLPGHESPVFQGVSVFIGIIFSLGSSSVIANVMSGLVITYMRSFKVGDRIKIGDVVGNVVEKTPFVTRIRTPKNEEVTIPNSGVMSAQTYNYSHSAKTYGLILHTKITCGYDMPWRQVHELLLEAARRTPDVQENPKPFILQTALDDFYAEYQLNVCVIDANKMPRIYSDLHQNIQDVFHEAGLEIVSPHYQAHRDGNRSTLPASYLPDEYQAPPFHVKIEK